MRRNYSQPSGSASYQRRYVSFRGVDFTNSPLYVDPTRSPYAENVIVDSAGVVHKRPRWAAIYKNLLEQQMHSMAFYKPPAKLQEESILVSHQGKTLYLDWHTGLSSDLNDADSQMFQFGGRLYILDGKGYRVMYYDDKAASWVFKYVYEVATPTETQVAGFYLAEEKTTIDGEQQQQTTIEYTWQFGEQGERNLLTGRRINTFCGDGIHDTFYFDCANFKVYKVEMYRLIPDQGSSTTEATVTISSGTNIRKSPSMSGTIITNTGSSTPTCVTTGKTGNWYQIVWQSQTAYVHQSRVTSSSGSATTMATDDKGWETLTGGYTVSEDNTKHCTKIVFSTKPPAHPRGNGLPNIRVTGAMTEVTTVSTTITQDMIDFGETGISIPESSMMTALISVAKNGTTLASSAYTVTYPPDTTHSATVTVADLAADDEITITYRRETFRDIDLIGKCNKYGQYGEYNHDRFFFTGNPDHLNRDWYSETSDPTIVLENSFTDIGDQHTGIAGYLNFQSDMLIIKYDSNGDNLFRRTADTDGDLTIFPVRAYKGRGVTSDKAIANVKGECVFLTPEGVYQFISSDLGSRYGTKEMSYTIKTRLLKENLSEGVMGVWNDWLLLTFPNGHCYVADTAQQTAPSSSGGYGWEWFFWTGCPFTHITYNTEDRTLYFAVPGYKVGFIDDGSAAYEPPAFADYPDGYDEPYRTITALWTTPLDEMEEPSRYKFLNRRGAMLQFDQNVPQMLEVAVVMDGKTLLLYRDEDMLQDYYTQFDYTLLDLKAATDIPYFTLNTPSERFRHLQFVFRNSDPETDGIGLMSLEFQYRFGRYII
jgi:uncharacterized protein YgiM (DUF1202 family)